MCPIKRTERRGHLEEDRQRAFPAAWCRWCGRELYPGEEAWDLGDGALHRACVEPYALSLARRRTLGEPGKGREFGEEREDG